MWPRTYICIDLKSYYASVECVDRGLDPMTAELVVADPDRGSGTICLAVSPALKAKGVPNRCRVHEIPKGMHYIKAKPRMSLYLERSAEIVAIYQRFVSMEDVHVYSVDECFIDITSYLALYQMSAVEFARTLQGAVLKQTGIPSTVGIGPNLFLAKVALDIKAKHAPGGIAMLDRNGFCASIWHHRPITDIWGIGRGIALRLARYGLFDLYDVAHANPELLRMEFGVNADLLIDHAHGEESCTIEEIKAYKPKGSSVSSGQVLMKDYTVDEALTVLREMVDDIVMRLAERDAVCARVSVGIGYSHKSKGKPYSSATRKLGRMTGRRSILMPFILDLYKEIVELGRPIRRLSVGASDLAPDEMESVDLFTDTAELARERSLTKVIAAVRKKFGRDAIMRGVSLFECATGFERARQIGGHRA